MTNSSLEPVIISEMLEDAAMAMAMTTPKLGWHDPVALAAVRTNCATPPSTRTSAFHSVARTPHKYLNPTCPAAQCAHTNHRPLA